jgi:hypothetical protein
MPDYALVRARPRPLYARCDAFRPFAFGSASARNTKARMGRGVADRTSIMQVGGEKS